MILYACFGPFLLFVDCSHKKFLSMHCSNNRNREFHYEDLLSFLAITFARSRKYGPCMHSKNATPESRCYFYDTPLFSRPTLASEKQDWHIQSQGNFVQVIKVRSLIKSSQEPGVCLFFNGYYKFIAHRLIFCIPSFISHTELRRAP